MKVNVASRKTQKFRVTGLRDGFSGRKQEVNLFKRTQTTRTTGNVIACVGVLDVVYVLCLFTCKLKQLRMDFSYRKRKL